MNTARTIITLLCMTFPLVIHGRPACELVPGVPSPDVSAEITAWQYPEYAANQCVRRLPENTWVGNILGHPLVTKLVGDFTGDGCDQDVLWRIPGDRNWILNKGLGGSEKIADGDARFSGTNPSQIIGTYTIGSAGQEGAVWSTSERGLRTSYWLDGAQETVPDTGISSWLNLHPEVVQLNPTPLKIVAIGDSFTAGSYNDPVANFRERLWQQLFDLTTCGREIALDWVGSVRDYDANNEPFLYGNDFYLDKEHEGHGSYKSCQVALCIDAWMDGRQCTKSATDPKICVVEEGPSRSAPYAPDIALMMTGMNDLLFADPNSSRKRQVFLDLIDTEIMPESVAYILDSVAAIRARNSNAVVALASLPAGGNPVGRSVWEDFAGYGDTFADYVEGREYLANKNYRRFNHALQQAAVTAVNGESPVIYVDQYTHFAGDPGVQFDRIHPTYGGHQQIADAYARALALFWNSDGMCSLPDVTPYVDTSNSSFLIGDFDADGCDQDIAFRQQTGADWSDRWMVLAAGGLAPYALAPDTAGADFNPGDLEQFAAAVDFDLDGLLDIVWRGNSDTAWQINFGDPHKNSMRVENTYGSSTPVFDLANQELVVMFCNWGSTTTLGWTTQIERDDSVWYLYRSDGQHKQVSFAGDWRNAPLWLSKGAAANPPCSIIGNS